MVKGALTHPQLARDIRLLGHGDQILITDGNYPISSHVSRQAKIRHLGFTAGKPKVTTILRVLLTEISVEKTTVMTPGETEGDPEIFTEFTELLKVKPDQLDRLSRERFYAAALKDNVRLVVTSGELRTYANLILTVGVVTA